MQNPERNEGSIEPEGFYPSATLGRKNVRKTVHIRRNVQKIGAYEQLSYTEAYYVQKKKRSKKSCPQVGFELNTLACEAKALPSELPGDVNWAVHASKASVDKN